MTKPRWRNVLRYVHCDPIRDIPEFNGLSQDYDGVALIWYRSWEARLQHVADEKSQLEMEDDERYVFKELVRNFATVTKESVLLNGPATGPKLICFLKRGSLDPQEFEAYWRARHAQQFIQETSNLVVRYTQNWPVAPEPSKPWGLESDLIEEIWFNDFKSMIAFKSSPTYQRLVEGSHQKYASEVQVIAAVEALQFQADDF